MLLSLALIFICGFALGRIMQKLKLPSLLGMIIVGIILGPYVLNLISPTILDVSIDLRQIALIIILTRAGLALNIKDLKKVGRPAILMCFIPATFELAAVTILAPMLFGISYLEAAIMGAVLAAVSPAVVIPRMLKLIKEGYGKEKSIPQLIMPGAAFDDIYVIVLFTSFLGIYSGQGFTLSNLAQVPIAIGTGIGLGVLAGLVLIWIFKKIHIQDTIKIVLLLSVSFLMISLEGTIKAYVPISGLLAVMAIGAIILRKREDIAKKLSNKYDKIWVIAEILLFVLVGAAININYVATTGIAAVSLIFLALSFRTIGVFVCMLKTKLNTKEKLFCAIAYIPKATVQAAIGSIPLALGIPAGNTILTVAVLAIMITAPIGAIGIDITYKKLLQKNTNVLKEKETLTKID